jgi:hypothetical protein
MRHSSAASIALTMRAKVGNASAPIDARGRVAVTSPRSMSILATRRSSTPPRSLLIVQLTAARRSRHSKARPAATITTRSGSIPRIPTSCYSRRIRALSISVNGGETWSSWYNQPTAQFYHVITDNQFPYWVYGGQQESGSAGVKSRGDNGAITFRDWRTVGVEEYGYVAPDPLHPNLIYGGKATRFDMTTGQVQNVAPEILRSGKYRFLRTAPILFSPLIRACFISPATFVQDNERRFELGDHQSRSVA